jgi:hypothetical protein
VSVTSQAAVAWLTSATKIYSKLYVPFSASSSRSLVAGRIHARPPLGAERVSQIRSRRRGPQRVGQERHRERGSLRAGRSPASLEATCRIPDVCVGMETIRVLVRRPVRVVGLGAVRKLAAPTPSPRPSASKPSSVVRSIVLLLLVHPGEPFPGPALPDDELQ